MSLHRFDHSMTRFIVPFTGRIPTRESFTLNYAAQVN